MNLFEEFKLYENMWDEPEVELKAADFIKKGYKAGTTSFDISVEGSDKTAAGTYPGMEALDKILKFLNSLNQKEKDAVGLGWYWDADVPGDALGDTIVFVAAPSEVEDFTSRSGSNLKAAEKPIRDALGIGHTESNSIKDTASQDYRVVLADYDTDDFDVNVEFGMQDPDENEVVGYEYLLKPGQTAGDLVVWLSRDCGYTSICVHDERPATPDDIKRLASDTFPVTGTGDEWQDYGDIVESIDSKSNKMSMAEAPAAKYEILYSDRHTEIVDQETMEQMVDELEMFERTDVSQIHRIYNNGKLGKTIWTEEEGLRVMVRE